MKVRRARALIERAVSQVMDTMSKHGDSECYGVDLRIVVAPDFDKAAVEFSMPLAIEQTDTRRAEDEGRNKAISGDESVGNRGST